MLDDYEKAYGLFQEAAALDEGRVESLAGMIQCRILQGIIDDAEKQLEFVSEIQISVGRTTEIAFLEALLESKKQGADD
jgi:tetratricopeptide repeat protein 21B